MLWECLCFLFFPQVVSAVGFSGTWQLVLEYVYSGVGWWPFCMVVLWCIVCLMLIACSEGGAGAGAYRVGGAGAQRVRNGFGKCEGRSVGDG